MLTPKQELFCHEYLKDRNATQAYIRAGYDPDGARQNGSRLMSNDYIRVKINELIRKQINKLKIEADFVLKRLLKRAEANIADAFNLDGSLKQIHEMPEHLQYAIIKLKSGKNGTSIEMGSQLKALELLGKHLKMFTGKHEIPELENLAERIKAARKRIGISNG